MSRRAPREIAYCGLSAAFGLGGLFLVLFWLVPSVWLCVTVLGTAVGLLLTTGALRAARIMAHLQRRALARFAWVTVDSPPPFEPGSGLLGRLDTRLTDRVAWRAVAYLVIRLPLAVVQGWVIAFAGCAVIDFLYPLGWYFLRAHPPGMYARPVQLVTPVPFGDLAISTWPGTLFASLVGVAMAVVAVLLARPAVAADAWLARALLGPDADNPDIAGIRELLADAHANARGALTDLRDLVRGIHPPVLDNGLPEALASLAVASAIPVTIAADLPWRPSPAIETIAYFCTAELVANAAKHSFANEVTVTIHSSAQRPVALILKVVDDGVGGADPARGSGLTGLAERVAVVDGVLGISSPPGGPTVVIVELPMEA